MNPSDQKRFDVLMRNYIQENLEVRVNGNSVTLQYLGHEIEGDAMWCYIEARDIIRVNRIEVKNTILLETYDDQINLVHIKNGGKIRSLKLYQNNTSDYIAYD